MAHGCPDRIPSVQPTATDVLRERQQRCGSQIPTGNTRERHR